MDGYHGITVFEIPLPIQGKECRLPDGYKPFAAYEIPAVPGTLFVVARKWHKTEK